MIICKSVVYVHNMLCFRRNPPWSTTQCTCSLLACRCWSKATLFACPT